MNRIDSLLVLHHLQPSVAIPREQRGRVGGGTVPHPRITIHHPCRVTGKPRIDMLTDNA
jgi:hypothetical protein